MKNEDSVFSGTTPTRREHSFPAVYRLTHQQSGKVYFGSTRDLYKRVNQHKNHLKAGTHKNRNLAKAWETDPHFDLSYIRKDTVEEARDVEQDFFDAFKDTGILMNIAVDDVNANGRGLRLSAETKDLLRERTFEQFSSEESRFRHAEITRQKWQDPAIREKLLSGPMSLAKPVIYEGIEYPSINAAARANGLSSFGIKHRLKKLSQEGK